MKEKRFWKILRRVLCCLLMAVVLALAALFVIPLTETGDKTQVQGSADWMAALEDEQPLNTITLPGTHDSATRYAQLGFFSKCQSMSIGEQLEAGYRYLDIRLAMDGDDLILVHGFTNCRKGPMPWDSVLKLDDVLDECYAFLAEHPSEAVVFAVKQERGVETAGAFQAALDGIIQREPGFWLMTDSIPALGEARGKLVLMRRYKDEAGLGTAAGIPLIWGQQKGAADTSLHTVREDQDRYVLWVQDRYEYNGDDKWAAFTEGLLNAGSGENDLALHFLSTKGTAAYGHPYHFARDLNGRLMNEEHLSGWIVVDFGSAPVAEHIYRANDRAG